MEHTFVIDEEKTVVEWLQRNRPEATPFQERLDGRNLYATTVDGPSGFTIKNNSPLFGAISYAFNSHCPLVIGRARRRVAYAPHRLVPPH